MMGDSSPKKALFWQVIGARAKGAAHARIGLPCQDAYAHNIINENLLVISVADGAGSASLAEVGSKLAAEESVRILTGHLKKHIPSDIEESAWARVLRKTFEETLGILKKEAENRDCHLRNLATTLILATANSNMASCFQIGDGAAVVAGPGGKMSILSIPQQGEYLNQTAFLTSLDNIKCGRFSMIRAKIAFISVFSDGLQYLSLKMPDYQPYNGFFEPLWRFVMKSGETKEKIIELVNFLDSPRLNERTDDDTTLVLAALR